MSTSGSGDTATTDYTAYESSFKSEREQWAQGLCECTRALGVGCCLYSFCCCVCAQATARTRYDTTNMCFAALCVSCAANRNLIREGYNLEGGCTEDICVSIFCGPCSAAQLLAETDKRGRVEPVMTPHQKRMAERNKKSRGKSSGKGKRRDDDDDVIPHNNTFNSGLCMCGVDGLGPCCAATFCVCCTSAQVRVTLQPSSDWCFNLCCLSPCALRNAVRESLRIPGNCCADACIGTFCTCCSTIQLAHEAERILLLRLVGDEHSDPVEAEAAVNALQAGKGDNKAVAAASAAAAKVTENVKRANPFGKS